MAGEATPLASGQAALRAGSWERARAAFVAVLKEAEDPAGLEGLAQAAWWLDDADQCIGAREAAYRRYRSAGDSRGAARAATALAWDCVLFGQGPAVARGWLGRAQELLTAVPEAEEHGWLAVREAEHALTLDHDPTAAQAAAERACTIGRRLSATDLEVAGLALSGLALTTAGDVNGGMRRLDTAVAAATGGDVADLMWMGKVCCWLIVACNETRDIDRALDWCRRVEAICVQRQLLPLFNVCRIQYASLQVANGTWDGAEQELTAALGRLSTSRRASRLDAVVQLGELRRRQGRLAEADELLSQAEFEPAAVVGRALIRLAQGDATRAWSSISSLLRSLPQTNQLGRAAVLLPAVLVATACGNLDTARAAADELRQTAATTHTHALLATSACADATLADSTLAGVPDTALPAATPAGAGRSIHLWRDAIRHFHLAGLRFDEAETRLHLAAALLGTGDVPGAREQIDAATTTLTDLAATAGLARARQLTDRIERRTSPLTPRETEVLQLVAQGLGNQQIAVKLVVSEHTVHRHVANILSKLDQPSRTAATTYALTNNLL
jgi:DNA-binding CsgD family transcriptional regulator